MIIKFDIQLNDDDIQYDGLSSSPPAVMILSWILPYLVNNVSMDNPCIYVILIVGQRDVYYVRIADDISVVCWLSVSQSRQFLVMGPSLSNVSIQRSNYLTIRLAIIISICCNFLILIAENCETFIAAKLSCNFTFFTQQDVKLFRFGKEIVS